MFRKLFELLFGRYLDKHYVPRDRYENLQAFHQERMRQATDIVATAREVVLASKGLDQATLDTTDGLLELLKQKHQGGRVH